jgi:2-polyprenyl-6-methoxyphenol hydroxylase-like FAD-dependent oxidoreductase
MSSEHTPVIVIGAGPTGLLAASELALAGVQVKVIDRLAQPDRIALRRAPAPRRASTTEHRQDVFFS